VRTNVALAANGGVATASSFQSGFEPSAATNGDRKGLNIGAGGVWVDATQNSNPDWLQVDFSGSKTIDEIDVFTAQDNYQNPIEPDLNMIFGLYGITAFDVQYWNGSAWVTVQNGSVTSNNKVWRKFVFSAVTTTKIRVTVNSSLHIYSTITELEAWSSSSSGFNVASFALTDRMAVIDIYGGDWKSNLGIFRPSEGTRYQLNTQSGF
jgi:hypothetical protein